MIINIRSLETGELVASYVGETNQECEKWADDNYGSNDYSWDYAA